MQYVIYISVYIAQEALCIKHKKGAEGTPPFLLRGAGTVVSTRAVITTATPMRESEFLGTSSSGQTTYDVIGRVGLAQTDSSCL